MPERLLYLKKPFVQDEIWQLANALSAKWNLQKRERFYREGLEGIIQTLSRIRSLHPIDMVTLLKYILKEIADLCDSKDGFFFMANNLTGTFNIEHRFGIGRFSTEQAIDEVFNRCKLLDNLISIIDKNQYCKVENLIVVPFRLEEKKYIFAAVAMEDMETEEHRRVLQIFGENALVSLQNAKLYQELEDINRNLEDKVRQQTEELRTKAIIVEMMAKQDLLTGFYNHFTLIELLDKEYQKSLRYKLDLSCCMVDLDHFKLVNDKYGHLFGDKVLKIITQVISDNTRTCDILGRYGGEEFVIVFTNTNLASALNCCERLRQKIERLEIPSDKESEPAIKITASFGVAGLKLGEPGASIMLIDQADKAMYEAKKAGRNCVYPFK
jgi:diguanylate cyclase (GGDEF)-like protein